MKMAKEMAREDEILDLNNGVLQHTHVYVPAVLVFQYSLPYGKQSHNGVNAKYPSNKLKMGSSHTSNRCKSLKSHACNRPE
jgi:hypothetical protein